jgi:hypothetical protein
MRAKPTTQPGRPRGSVTLRMRDEVRADLQKEADARGHSLSEEIEGRLERSLLDQRIAIDVFDLLYGAKTNDVLLALGRIVKAVVDYRPFYLNRLEVGWLNYPWKFDQVVKAVNVFFERLRPTGKIEVPESIGEVYVGSLSAAGRKATPQERAAIKELHARAAQIEAEQAANIGVLIAEREIEKLVSSPKDEIGPILRDQQIAARLKREPKEK